MATYTSTLHCINSKISSAGACYWAFQFTDEDGVTVEARICGGESNIYGILRYWNVPNDWDRSINFSRTEMKIRDFDRLTKSWPYAGSHPEELAAFIRKSLKEKKEKIANETNNRTTPPAPTQTAGSV